MENSIQLATGSLPEPALRQKTPGQKSLWRKKRANCKRGSLRRESTAISSKCFIALLKYSSLIYFAQASTPQAEKIFSTRLTLSGGLDLTSSFNSASCEGLAD